MTHGIRKLGVAAAAIALAGLATVGCYRGTGIDEGVAPATVYTMMEPIGYGYYGYPFSPYAYNGLLYSADGVPLGPAYGGLYGYPYSYGYAGIPYGYVGTRTYAPRHWVGYRGSSSGKTLPAPPRVVTPHATRIAPPPRMAPPHDRATSAHRTGRSSKRRALQRARRFRFSERPAAHRGIAASRHRLLPRSDHANASRHSERPPSHR